MLTRFGHFVLRGRLQAAIMALLFSVIPFMGWLGMMIVGLVTLRKGMVEGFLVLLWACVPALALLFTDYTDVYPSVFIIAMLAGAAYVWLMAGILRFSASWSFVLEVSALLAMALVALLHWMVPDIVSWWADRYEAMIAKMIEEMSTTGASAPIGFEQIKELLQQKQKMQSIAAVATGAMIAVMMMTKMVMLSLSRWWQALLFNPQGLRPELYNVRLGYTALAVSIAAICFAWMRIPVAIDVMPVLVITFALAGLSIVHCFLGQSKNALVKLIIFYCALIILPSLILGALFLLAAIDSLFNLRKRWLRVE